LEAQDLKNQPLLMPCATSVLGTRMRINVMIENILYIN